MEVEQYETKCAGKTVYIYLLSMSDSYFLWIGSDPSIKEVAVGMKTRPDSEAISTRLLGSQSNAVSLNLAQKLAHKFKGQFFVSCSFSDPIVLPQVESWLLKHFQQRQQLLT